MEELCTKPDCPGGPHSHGTGPEPGSPEWQAVQDGLYRHNGARLVFYNGAEYQSSEREHLVSVWQGVYPCEAGFRLSV